MIADHRTCIHGRDRLPIDMECRVCLLYLRNQNLFDSIPPPFSTLTRPCQIRHSEVVHDPNCGSCVKWETDTKFREVWEKFMEEERHRLMDVPCIHRGPVVPLIDRDRLELDTIRDWYLCGLGFGKNGIVCPCQGCTPLCRGYELPDDPSSIES